MRGAPPRGLTPSPFDRTKIRGPQKSRNLPLGIRRLVPTNFPTIQAAIDASVDGDTVLVSEGTYFENIRYRGKAITVASLYLVDGDTTHIDRTIIDGSKSTDPDSCSVVYFVNGEDTTSVLCGLTIQGGKGTHFFWFPPAPLIRGGGGVFCCAAGVRLVRNIIRHNRVIGKDAAAGGGVEAYEPARHPPDLFVVAAREIAYVRAFDLNDSCPEIR